MAKGRARASGSQEEKEWERGGKDREEACCLVPLNFIKRAFGNYGRLLPQEWMDRILGLQR